MPTAHVIAASKAERLRREQRFYGPEDLGPTCPECQSKVPTAIGETTHPTCGPEFRALFAMAGSQAARAALTLVKGGKAA
ncbi:hypothetical protein [Nocardioides sp. R-C-SC26]|uniref:hypothetical protein n=1 Tax=Nocardioides sp. R-C-SC26 TaxID=2870414 RepID=UPI001E5F7EEB|nr:hypothetical protein [Nocardioides sp. R-C-SC26]